MHDKHLYEYAVIRVVPRVEREEFINVGVILYCKTLRFLGMQYQLQPERAMALHPMTDCEPIRQYLLSMEQVCRALPGSGPIGQLDLPSRFRWLTATRSTVIQCSKVHSGFCDDGPRQLRQLFEQLVM